MRSLLGGPGGGAVYKSVRVTHCHRLSSPVAELRSSARRLARRQRERRSLQRLKDREQRDTDTTPATEEVFNA